MKTARKRIDKCKVDRKTSTSKSVNKPKKYLSPFIKAEIPIRVNIQK